VEEKKEGFVLKFIRGGEGKELAWPDWERRASSWVSSSRSCQEEKEKKSSSSDRKK